MTAATYSPQTPGLRLESYRGPGELSKTVEHIYGEGHTFTYREGGDKDMSDVRLGMVRFDIGGRARNSASSIGGVVAEFSAWMVFPPAQEELAVKGMLVLAETPPREELEIIAGSLMQLAAEKSGQTMEK